MIGCSRCACLTDSQIGALLSTDTQVGRVHLTRLGQLMPVELDRALGRRERSILVALLADHPQMVEFSELGDPLKPGEVNLLGIGALVSNLNAKLTHYYVRIVRKQTRGYYLVEVRI